MGPRPHQAAGVAERISIPTSIADFGSRVSTEPKRYRLPRWTWTVADFEEMGWHDVWVHGIATVEEPPHQFPKRMELLLDIDYKLDWVHQGENLPFKYWMAPATLAFENVFDLSIRLDTGQPGLDIDGITREDRTTAIGQRTWEWTIRFHQGEIRFWSTGFAQYFRRAPLLSENSYFTNDQRGGISFARGVETRAFRNSRA